MTNYLRVNFPETFRKVNFAVERRSLPTILGEQVGKLVLINDNMHNDGEYHHAIVRSASDGNGSYEVYVIENGNAVLRTFSYKGLAALFVPEGRFVSSRCYRKKE